MSLQSAITFVKVIEAKGFSAAARQMGKSKAYVSQQVSKLEDRLGTRLLQRTTRKLSLTDAGRIYYKYAREAVSKLQEGEERTREFQEDLKGRIKISIVDGGLGEWYLAPAIAHFAALNPGISIDLDLSSRLVDLVGEGFDFVIRVGNLEDSSLIARKLTSFRFGLYASPAYLEQHGVVATPDQLKKHNCLTGATARWHFSQMGKIVEFTPQGSWHSKSGQALTAVAKAGLGIVRVASFYADRALAAGDIVEILPDWTRQQTPVWIVYPSSHNLSRRVNCAINFLRDEFSGKSAWD